MLTNKTRNISRMNLPRRRFTKPGESLPNATPSPYSNPKMSETRPPNSEEIQSYQAHRSETSANVFTSNKISEPRDHRGVKFPSANTVIGHLQSFGPNLEALERRTSLLFMDQESLHFNLINRGDRVHYSPQTSPLRPPQTSLEKLPRVKGPLQHPFIHFIQSDGSFASQDSDSGYDGDDVEMPDAPEQTEHQYDNEDAIPTMPSSSTRSSAPSRASHHLPVGSIIKTARHPILLTATTSILEQIDLEISLLIVKKHEELRLIQTELAKAQIMLEQLRRVHLKPFFRLTDENGDVHMMRLVCRKFGVAEKKRTKEEQAVVRLAEEEEIKGGRGLSLRNKYIKR